MVIEDALVYRPLDVCLFIPYKKDSYLIRLHPHSFGFTKQSYVLSLHKYQKITSFLKLIKQDDFFQLTEDEDLTHKNIDNKLNEINKEENDDLFIFCLSIAVINNNITDCKNSIKLKGCSIALVCNKEKYNHFNIIDDFVLEKQKELLNFQKLDNKKYISYLAIRESTKCLQIFKEIVIDRIHYIRSNNVFIRKNNNTVCFFNSENCEFDIFDINI